MNFADVMKVIPETQLIRVHLDDEHVVGTAQALHTLLRTDVFRLAVEDMRTDGDVLEVSLGGYLE